MCFKPYIANPAQAPVAGRAGAAAECSVGREMFAPDGKSISAKDPAEGRAQPECVP